MRLVDLLQSPIVMGVLALLALVIVLKLLGLAMKAIVLVMLLGLAVFGYLVASNGGLG